MLDKDRDIFKLMKKNIKKFKHFYKEKKNIDVNSIKKIEDIPFIGRDDFSDIINYINLDDAFFTIMTSGSRSEKFFIFRSKRSYQAHLARQIKIYRKVGFNSKDRFLNLLSYSISGAARIIDRAIESLGVSFVPVGSITGKKSLCFAVEAIQQLKPTVIEGYVNEIYDIFSILGRDHSVKKCIVTGEFLSSHFKDKLEKKSGAKVYNNYGSMEFSGIAISESPDDKYMRIYEEDIYTEIIKNNGDINNTGEGQLVITDLLNCAMPFIRYKVGDRVKIIKNKGKKYIKVLGREQESILIDGEPFNKRILVEKIREVLDSPNFFILINKNKDNYQDQLVVNIPENKKNNYKIIKNFFANELDLLHISKINFYKREIPKTSTGKYRHIVDLRKNDR
ncbi:MAG: hypothetical protein K9L76_01380 [Candidatus Omnitrophica bacterium]|nr:hypothetical protein [Candidatus Omnitrophota bacterium]